MLRASGGRRWELDRSAAAGGRRSSERPRSGAVSLARTLWLSPRGSSAEQLQRESNVSFFPVPRQLPGYSASFGNHKSTQNRRAPGNRNALDALQSFLE